MKLYFETVSSTRDATDLHRTGRWERLSWDSEWAMCEDELLNCRNKSALGRWNAASLPLTRLVRAQLVAELNGCCCQKGITGQEVDLLLKELGLSACAPSNGLLFFQHNIIIQIIPAATGWKEGRRINRAVTELSKPLIGFSRRRTRGWRNTKTRKSRVCSY